MWCVGLSTSKPVSEGSTCEENNWINFRVPGALSSIQTLASHLPEAKSWKGQEAEGYEEEGQERWLCTKTEAMSLVNIQCRCSCCEPRYCVGPTFLLSGKETSRAGGCRCEGEEHPDKRLPYN